VCTLEARVADMVYCTQGDVKEAALAFDKHYLIDLTLAKDPFDKSAAPVVTAAIRADARYPVHPQRITALDAAALVCCQCLCASCLLCWAVAYVYVCAHVCVHVWLRDVIPPLTVPLTWPALEQAVRDLLQELSVQSSTRYSLSCCFAASHVSDP